MEYRNLGSSGLRVSLVGLGCNNFGMRLDLEQTRAVVDRAFDLGITLFDTADMYGGRGGSETQLGKILGHRRKDIVLASKFGMAMSDDGTKIGASRRYIMSAVEDSLRRLKTDWIDLYQLHQPDPLTPLDETMQALDDLVTQGKIRYIGCSNLPSWQVVESQWISKSMGLNRFVSCQDEYNILNRNVEAELIPAMQKYGCGLLPYFPLASGLLTGKYKRTEMPEGARLTDMPTFANRVYLTDENFDIVDNLNKFAHKTGHSILELAFGWMASRPATASIIAGATKPEQIDANVAAVNWVLSQSEIDEVNKISAR
uniref:Predicted oxidoreductases (Related to aryl-alcohol dehydrogenases) n=1 Tax=uncultured alpha proteobacterium HF0130_20P23 TaxID=710809 RepID=E0XT90_9PROT|nr:predicted oxidoreductases (related to aryl-alcohol dehydrogenases) [uncultured alpha proteobacterium HF0130_20P23]